MSEDIDREMVEWRMRAERAEARVTSLVREVEHLRKTLAGLHDLHAATAQGITNTLRGTT